MKVLVPVKRVLDYNVKVRLRQDGLGVDLTGQKMAMNPFDEVALEEAVRLKERGQAREVIVVSCGETACQETLRHALALGADRAVLLETNQVLQPLAVAKLLALIARRESVSLVMCGKQAIDDDAAQVGPMLAALLGWPQACFVTRIDPANERITVVSALDGCEDTCELSLPAVVTAELHLNAPRFASLANVMKARRAVIEITSAESLGIDVASRIETIGHHEPPPRPAGKVLPSVAALVQHLRDDGMIKEGAA